ncbi:MAG: two-component sensor histidine kinase [Rhodoferax sp.]|nr:two-component sensor histidine kinase [Rhodoferax sp.]
MADVPAQRIAQLEAELAGLRAEMQDFSYTVSHDLRASLRHILSYAQLVQEDAAELLPEETRGFLNTISDSARHMGVLMDGLMELSRLGTVVLQTGPVPLQPLVQDVMAELAQKYPQRAIAWQLAPDLPKVQADATLLRAALLYVLDNAVKFTAQRPEAQIALSALPAAHGLVTLAVQDNGAGFNPALQSKLFHPFQRLHTTKQFPGIGMGLALTRKMLERMGGSVRAEGAVDAGCRIHLAVPAVPQA